MTTKAQAARMEQARVRLRELLSPGDVVYTKVLHVSRTGMTRVIGAYVVRDGEILDVSRDASLAMGAQFDRDHWGVKMGGAGMDMTFALVYSLSRSLWPHGVPCTGSTGCTKTGRKAKHPRCHSNDHGNGDRVYRRGKIHSDGGYALTRFHL